MRIYHLVTGTVPLTNVMHIVSNTLELCSYGYQRTLFSSFRLIAICEDVYVARAEGKLEVEEVLYWTLVKIYRSPHMLLEYTKPD